MNRITMALLFALMSGTAMAQEFPEIYRVVGVEDDDVLNIRAEPDAGSEILAAYEPDADRIEVTAASDDGAWLRVNIDEGTGWIAARFAEPQEDAPFAMNCAGTEPFWSVNIERNSVIYRTPNRRDALESPQLHDLFEGARLPRAITGEQGEYAFALAITPGECSDGMSDRMHSLHGTLILTGPSEHIVQGGCCSMQP
ncbi:SH3 domain-containing protein [Roseobacter sp. HKCCA0434]|uniref:SH3 domain-containing protein n=1 Tax=Roseobacter sp. HKCCA0434 TaxID=3079297 RepID=UPI002905874A|nr:SH3 domain-containing protein [Roseobacter sp. HKCCA0434]